MRRSLPKALFLIVCATAFGCASLPAAEQLRSGGPYVPTPQPVVEEMLSLAGVRAGDFVVDLGSGDGRIVLTAATRYRARGMGVDLDAKLVEQSNAQARRQKLERQVKFVQQDALKTDFSGATVVTLYLLPEFMHKLRDRLLGELRPGARVVSHDFTFTDWRHDRSIDVNLAEKFEMPGAWQSTVYLWIVPARIDGRWQASIATRQGESFVFGFKQQFQRFEGESVGITERLRVEEGRLEGERISFRLARGSAGGNAAYEFQGRVEGDVMRGEVVTAQGRLPWQASRIRALGR